NATAKPPSSRMRTVRIFPIWPPADLLAGASIAGGIGEGHGRRGASPLQERGDGDDGAGIEGLLGGEGDQEATDTVSQGDAGAVASGDGAKEVFGLEEVGTAVFGNASRGRVGDGNRLLGTIRTGEGDVAGSEVGGEEAGVAEDAEFEAVEGAEHADTKR